MNPEDATAALSHRLEITERLRVLEDAEAEGLTRNSEILRLVAGEQQEEPGVRPPLVELAGGVEVAWLDPAGHRGAAEGRPSRYRAPRCVAGTRAGRGSRSDGVA